MPGNIMCYSEHFKVGIEEFFSPSNFASLLKHLKGLKDKVVSVHQLLEAHCSQKKKKYIF